MKKIFLLLLLAPAVFVQAQSLKEALYSGKLKNEPGTVIRKSDDLASKMDTTQKVAPVETFNANAPLPEADSSTKRVTTQTEPAAPANTDIKDNSVDAAQAVAPAAVVVPTAAVATKNNNAMLKLYMDSVAGTLNTEVMSSKKIKRGSYFVLVTYAIDTVGQVTFSDVFVSPENDYLQQQVKERLALETPRLTPVLSSNGAPRKVIKKYNFTLTKE